MGLTREDLRKEAAATRPGNMLWLLKTGHFADFKIHCGKHTFNVHRAVISHNCDYFKTLTTSSFKEGVEQEVNFPEDEPALIVGLILFLYAGHYFDQQPTCHRAIDQFKDIDMSEYKLNQHNLHIDMYSLGEKLCIAELSRLATCEFKNWLREQRDRLQTVNYFTALRCIYSSTAKTARDLKDFMVLVMHALLITPNSESRTVEQVERTIHAVPELGVDMAILPVSRKSYRCKSCGAHNLVLILRCSHEEVHEYRDKACFEQNLRIQSCLKCVATDVYEISDSVFKNNASESF